MVGYICTILVVYFVHDYWLYVGQISAVNVGSELYDFESEVDQNDLTFAEFTALLEQPRTGDASSRPMYYLQQRLLDTCGSELAKDIAAWKWDWVLALATEGHWGSLTTNLLLVGEPGTITPLHYDEQENVFAQIQGRKQFVLYPPSEFCNMYPYPFSHPADRQSQVDILAPDTEKFPLFANSTGYHAMLDAGDVLYLPACWWHHVSSPFELTISVNFWFTQRTSGEGIELPLKDHTSLVALRRNLEKLLVTRLGAKRAHDFFAALDQGGMLPGHLHHGVLEATSMLLHVLEPEDATPFLRSMVKGRFRYLPLHPSVTAPQAL